MMLLNFDSNEKGLRQAGNTSKREKATKAARKLDSATSKAVNSSSCESSRKGLDCFPFVLSRTQ